MGKVQVYGFPDTANASDNRSFAEKTLALVEAEIQARIPGSGAGVESFSIGIPQFAGLKLEDLMALRAKLAAELAIEQYGRMPDVEAYFVRA